MLLKKITVVKGSKIECISLEDALKEVYKGLKSNAFACAHVKAYK